MDAQIGEGLRRAMILGARAFNRSAEQAVNHAMITMAKSARAMTRGGARLRKVQKDPNFGQFVEVWKQRKDTPTLLFKWKFPRSKRKQVKADRVIKGTWENARVIKLAGLAKQSWFFGLASLGLAPGAGRGRLRFIASGRRFRRGDPSRDKRVVVGAEIDNRLSYLSKRSSAGAVLPSGWQNEVARRATAVIIKTTTAKIARLTGTAMRQARAA